MKHILLISIFIWAYTIDTKPYTLKINQDTSKLELKEMIEDAKEKGIEIRVNYASYDEKGRLKVIQLFVKSGEFSGTATQDFIKSNKCLKIIRDFNSKAKVPFEISGCEI